MSKRWILTLSLLLLQSLSAIAQDTRDVSVMVDQPYEVRLAGALDFEAGQVHVIKINKSDDECKISILSGEKAFFWPEVTESLKMSFTDYEEDTSFVGVKMAKYRFQVNAVGQPAIDIRCVINASKRRLTVDSFKHVMGDYFEFVNQAPR